MPGNVLVAVDAGEPIIANDERFDTLSEITWKKGHGSSPHNKKTRGNALFQDGSVYTVRVWTRPAGMARTLSTAPAGFPAAFTDLRDWMVMHPGHRLPGSVNQAATDEDVWTPRKPLPF